MLSVPFLENYQASLLLYISRRSNELFCHLSRNANPACTLYTNCCYMHTTVSAVHSSKWLISTYSHLQGFAEPFHSGHACNFPDHVLWIGVVSSFQEMIGEVISVGSMGASPTSKLAWNALHKRSVQAAITFRALTCQNFSSYVRNGSSVPYPTASLDQIITSNCRSREGNKGWQLWHRVRFVMQCHGH